MASAAIELNKMVRGVLGKQTNQPDKFIIHYTKQKREIKDGKVDLVIRRLQGRAPNRKEGGRTE